MGERVRKRGGRDGGGRKKTGVEMGERRRKKRGVEMGDRE